MDTKLCDYPIKVIGEKNHRYWGGKESIRKNTTTDLRIYQITNGHCFYCGVELTANKEPGSTNSFEIDHIIPRYYGGYDKDYNLVPSCRSCNRTKKTNPLSYLRQHLFSKYGGILFTEAQKAFLANNNVQLPYQEPYKFYYEEMIEKNVFQDLSSGFTCNPKYPYQVIGTGNPSKFLVFVPLFDW